MTNAETNVTSRKSNERLRGAHSEVRTEKVREKQFEPYRPRGSQEIPAALYQQFADKGYHLHWVRMTIEDKPDTANLADARHKGYEPVNSTEIPENILRTLQVSDIAGFSGLVVSKDTALWKVPVERFSEIRKYYTDIADTQLKSVNEQLRDNAKVHGIEVKLYDESKSEVAFGKNSRKVAAQEDSADEKDD